MTFTYTEDLTDDRDYVRFHTGDTEESTAFLSDEIIASIITSKGSNNAAVIAAIQHIILKLSKPDFRADWLQVSNSSARKGYEMMLKEKRSELGVSKFTASATHVYRKDSLQDTEPTYDS